MKFICHQCEITFEKRPSSRRRAAGRPWKHTFCSRNCYNEWRKEKRREIDRNRHKFRREVWGTIPLGRFDVAKSKSYGREAEILAVNTHLPAEGFSEIDDFSGCSNQFFIDFVATYEGQRVLVDATVKLHAWIPNKVRLAKSLGMRLFIIHVSLAREGLYFIQEVPWDRTTVRVPMRFIREKFEEILGCQFTEE